MWKCEKTTDDDKEFSILNDICNSWIYPKCNHLIFFIYTISVATIMTPGFALNVPVKDFLLETSTIKIFICSSRTTLK